MVAEVLEALLWRPAGLYVDGTVGEGGHAQAILERLSREGELWGLDRDPMVLERAASRLASYTSVKLFHCSYAELGEVLAREQRSSVSGILLDLGVSLFTLKKSGRGFSFERDEPLDMRFNPLGPGPTAAQLLNTASEQVLGQIFGKYGEEPRARQLAQLIVKARRQKPITTTAQLVDLINQAVRSRRVPAKVHPATRAFQALRIAVNRELEELQAFLDQSPAWLQTHGRLVILAYHSLEDRLVKRALMAWEQAGIMRRWRRKPLRPTPEEVSRNPRARSARMRAAEKITPTY